MIQVLFMPSHHEGPVDPLLLVAVWIVFNLFVLPGVVIHYKKYWKEDSHEPVWVDISWTVFVIANVLAAVGGAVFLIYNLIK